MDQAKLNPTFLQDMASRAKPSFFKGMASQAKLFCPKALAKTKPSFGSDPILVSCDKADLYPKVKKCLEELDFELRVKFF